MKGGVFALGNFDGVHRGHCAVIDAAVKQARLMHVYAHVLTFEPHPRTFFQPQSPPFRLTPFNVKERLLKSCGIDTVETMPFTAEIANMPARDFVERILLERYGVEHLVAGHDFVFGHNREGTMKRLADWLAPHGIGVTEIEELGKDGETYSSTRVRELLLEGEVREAADILGRDWSIEGTVVAGSWLGGRTIGFPTANIELGTYLRPKLGVYAIRAGRPGKPLTQRGVANIGFRPTLNGKTENLEAYLFDFNQDIYGQEWEFALIRFIRSERKFDNLDELKAQIAKDVEMAGGV
jgi:riboflavin kinase / FMN adenylyltransferase